MVHNLQIVDRHLRQLGAQVEQRANVVDAPRAHRVDEPANGRSVHERLELRPAVEAVRAREDNLRIMQCKRLRVRAVIVGVDFGDRGAVALSERLEQLLGLAFELIEVRLRAERAGGERLSRHDELHSGAAVAVPAPAVRSLGQKRVHRSKRS